MIEVFPLYFVVKTTLIFGRKCTHESVRMKMTYMLVLAVDTIQSATKVTTSTPELS